MISIYFFHYSKYFYSVMYMWNDKEFYYNLPLNTCKNLDLIGTEININVNKHTGKYINNVQCNIVPIIKFLRFFLCIIFCILLMNILVYGF